MKLNLYRLRNTDTYCMGRLYIATSAVDELGFDTYVQDYYLCDTIEPPVVGKGAKASNGSSVAYPAIPAGIYPLIVNRSAKFCRDLPLLDGVPGRKGIRIHRGNTAADTHGCILPGHYVGGGRLVSSTVREDDIVSLLSNTDDDHFIEIFNNFALAEDVFSPQDVVIRDVNSGNSFVPLKGLVPHETVDSVLSLNP